MRILRTLLLPAVLLLAACDGDGTLPASDPLHGEWIAPTTVRLDPFEVDRGELSYLFRPDGSYEAKLIAWDEHGGTSTVVFENRSSGAYRIEAGGLSMRLDRYRSRFGASGWEDAPISEPPSFGPPLAYTVSGDQLTLHYPAGIGEHGEPTPPSDKVFTRR